MTEAQRQCVLFPDCPLVAATEQHRSKPWRSRGVSNEGDRERSTAATVRNGRSAIALQVTPSTEHGPRARVREQAETHKEIPRSRIFASVLGCLAVFSAGPGTAATYMESFLPRFRHVVGSITTQVPHDGRPIGAPCHGPGAVARDADGRDRSQNAR